VDQDRIIAEVAKRNGVLLHRDDPILQIQTMLDLHAAERQARDAEIIEVPAEVDLRITPILAEMKAVREDIEKAARRPLMTSDQIKRDVLPAVLGIMNGVRPFIAAALFVAALWIGGGLGYWRGSRAMADSYAKLPAEWSMGMMTNRDAARWLDLMRKNPQKGVFDDCKAVPQPNGGKACSFVLWTDPPRP
jgi:hypothetical protein